MDRQIDVVDDRGMARGFGARGETVNLVTPLTYIIKI